MATWSYSGDPQTDSKDAVRFLVGDTGPIAPSTAPAWLLCDEEYIYLLTEYTSPLSAAAAAADALCAKFARQIDELTGDLQRKCSQRSKAYGNLADKLRKQASNPATSTPISFGGGISCRDIQTREEDTDRFPDIFHIGENDSRKGLGLKQQSDRRFGGFNN